MVHDSFRAQGWESNINLIVYLSIIMSGIGITWLALNNVPAGIRYITIFLVGISFLFMSFFFINENQKDTVKKIIKNPFETDYSIASGLYILGWIVPILFSVIGGLFSAGFSVAQVMIPLSATDIISELSQSFSIAQVEADPFWQWFITVFTAGTIEELVFGFILMLVGSIIGMLVWKLIFNDAGNSDAAKWFYTATGLVLTGAIFGLAHMLNGSYVGYMFLIAIIFRVAMNFGIYVLGVFLSFTMGYHQSNNAVWFYQTYGAGTTFKAIFSVGGAVILIYFTLILYYLIRNWDDVVRKIPKVFNA